MKVQKFVMLFAVVLIALSMMAFTFLPAVMLQEGDPLPEWQVVIVGLFASLVVQVLKFLASKGFTPKKEHVAIGLYVVSFGLALAFKAFTLPGFPPFTDAPSFMAALLTYLGTLITLASPIVGWAFLIYNLLLKRVLDGLALVVKKQINA